MIAQATLCHHQAKEWLRFWAEKKQKGINVLYTHRVASVCSNGEILEFIIDRDVRVDIETQLAKITGE